FAALCPGGRRFCTPHLINPAPGLFDRIDPFFAAFSHKNCYKGSSQPVKKLTYSVLEADAGRIDILVARLLDFSRARVRGLMDHEGVTLNGEECQDYGTHVAADDVVVLTYDPERKYREKTPERKTHGITLIFRDEHLAIVNKEAGILTVPTDRREKNTLACKLLERKCLPRLFQCTPPLSSNNIPDAAKGRAAPIGAILPCSPVN
ncbi:MAG TPA: S4 domain-containing protein, partial [Oligoflexus sp.]|uniref:S4 domain-containing protein n=1 Tax=Oligoflexus sp. TaxID=1971216 RepID=UPI002D234653